MPGIALFGTTKEPMVPTVEVGLIGKNTYIRAGDPLLVTTVSARTAGPRVLRPFYNSDNGTGGRSGGFAGIALYTIWTDANGKPIVPTANEGLTLLGPTVAYPLQAIEMSQYEPTQGYTRVVFLRWTPGNQFVAKAKSDEAFTEADVGKLVLIYDATAATKAAPDVTVQRWTIQKGGTITNPYGRVVRVILPDPSATGNGQQYVVVEPVSAADQIGAGNTATD